MRNALALLALAGSLLAEDAATIIKGDVQLRAMADELARTKTLQISTLDKPYFIVYAISDTQEAAITASLGGILSTNAMHARFPQVQVRVGDYPFDNTNSIFSNAGRFGVLPIDDDYFALRNNLWLISDGMYKTAVDEITRKRNALREIAEPDKTPDFTAAKPLVLAEPPAKLEFDRKKWEAILRDASARFTAAPSVTQSSLRLRVISSTYRLINSEGTVIRVPQELCDIAIRAEGLAPDGGRVWNFANAVVLKPRDLPSAAAVAKMAETAAAETESLIKAPIGEDYSGPVLFEQEAAAQMIASSLVDAIRLKRKPLAPPNANAGQILEGVWSSKLGAKVVPEWLSIVDDPLKEEYRGTPLAGSYKVDDEGVAAQRLVLVDKGVFKTFLASREPVRNIVQSNGHGRLPGSFGTEEAVPSSLFVEAAETTGEKEMKAKLIEKVKTAGLKYGLLIRKLDFPSTAGIDELKSLSQQMQKSGYSRTLNSPVLAYRVYTDGREELVRGLRFKDFSAKDLRDIAAASDHPAVFNYVTNGSGFNYADASAHATTSTVVSPSLLFDSLDLARADTEPGKLPLVPAPALAVQ